MGTAEERVRRQSAASAREKVVQWMQHGGYHSDDDLRQFLSSIGANPDGPLFKEFFGGGGAAGNQGGGGLQEMYGPSADPMKNYDLASGMFQWRILNPDGSLKYPDWNQIDPSELSRIQAFYNWRQSPEGVQLARNYGGSAIAAWYANHGNSPDMSWTGHPAGYWQNGGGWESGSGGGVHGGPAGVGGSIGGMGGAGGAGGLLGTSNLDAEMLARARQDRAQSLFDIYRQGLEYGEARPVGNFLQDFYGDALGVSFDHPNYNLQDYVNYSGNGPQSGSPPGQVPAPTHPPTTPTTPTPHPPTPMPLEPVGPPTPNAPDNDNPSSPAFAAASRPVSMNTSGDVRAQNGLPRPQWCPNAASWDGLQGRCTLADQSGAHDIPNPNGSPTSPVNPSTSPNTPPNPNNYHLPPNADPNDYIYEQPPTPQQALERLRNGTVLPGDPIYDYYLRLANQIANPDGAGGGTAAPLTPLPTIPFSSGGGYHLQSGDVNPDNSRSFGLLAPQINAIGADLNSQMRGIRDYLPAGSGEVNRARAQAVQGAYANKAATRQAFAGQAIQGLNNIYNQKAFQVPGSSDSGALNNLYQGSLQKQAMNNQNVWNLQQLTQAEKQRKSGLWGSLLGSLGALGSAAIMSDERVKEDVKPYRKGLTTLRKLKPVEYKYNGLGGSEKGEPGVSLIAQEAERVDPESVERVNYTDIPELRLLSLSRILMTTINAVKQLDQKISKRK